MTDARQMAFEPPDQIAADDLLMIEIELQLYVRPLEPGDDVSALLGTCQKIIRPVAGIDWFDQQRDVVGSRKIGRLLQVGDQRALCRRALFGRHNAGHAMNGVAADGDGVIERLFELCGKFLLPPWHGREPRLPRTSQRRVDAEHDQAKTLQLAAYCRRGFSIRKLSFYGLESRFGCSFETLQQR